MQPLPGEEPKFVQIYFMGDEGKQARQSTMQQYSWCPLEVVLSLQEMLHQHNLLTRSFKQAAELVTSSDYRVVLRADKAPMGERAQRFNAPTSAEVVVLLVGQDH